MINFWIPVAVLVFTFIFNIPISLGLISSGVVYLAITGADLGIVADKIVNGMYGNYTILAVPMFVLMANFMNSGKVTQRLFDFCKALIGRKRGALAQVNVLTSVIFAGMSGSAVADASGVGMIEIEAMKEDGYDLPFSCALTSATSTVGPIIPPSIPMVIYAMLSGASVGALFMGGVVPGLLIGGALSIYSAVVSIKRNYPRGQKYTFKQFCMHTFKAIPALMAPVILLVGIYSGVMTPTEAGAIAALYSLLISVFVYRSMSWKQIIGCLKDTALQTGRVTIMTAASCVMSYMVAKEGVSVAAANFILSLTNDRYFILFLIILVFTLLGMILDVGVIQYIFLPIVIPVVSALGIDLVHFGVCIVLVMMIGLSTPPFGMCLFITASISGCKLKDISREILPMCAVMMAILFLITYIPALVTWLPQTMGYMG
ncbi:MAG TPA: TRAP transporter large permease [Feifaniaceae bacterium]|nr:TRAP transporter large permease [Feifaniaceae bacterium]